MNQINSLFESYINMFKVNGKLNLLNLQPGQVVKGQIIELIDSNNALLSINNNKMIAKLEVPLIKGQTSWFVVSSVGDDIKLRILTEDSSTNKPVTDIQGLMSKLNIKNTNMNRTIINEIVKMEIPLEKELVENISHALKKNPNIESVMQAVKLLKNKNIITSNINIRSINELFQNQDILNKLSNVNKGIQEILIKTSNDNKDKLSYSQSINSGGNIISTDISMTKLQKDSLGVNDNNLNIQGSDKMISQLLKVSTQIESILKSFENYNSSKTIDMNNFKINNELSDINIEKIDSKQILTNVTKFIDLLQQQYSFNSIDNNLSRNLEGLLKYKSNLPNELSMNIERTINHIVGQNIALVHEQSIFSQTILQFPGFVPFSEKPVFVQVHTKKKEGSKNIDSEDMTLVFLFNLDNLGDVMVQMKILHKQLFLQINNDNPNIKEIINILEPDFIRFIEKNGYQTSGLSVASILRKHDINNPSYISSYKGVDIKI